MEKAQQPLSTQVSSTGSYKAAMSIQALDRSTVSCLHPGELILLSSDGKEFPVAVQVWANESALFQEVFSSVSDKPKTMQLDDSSADLAILLEFAFGSRAQDELKAAELLTLLRLADKYNMARVMDRLDLLVASGAITGEMALPPVRQLQATGAELDSIGQVERTGLGGGLCLVTMKSGALSKLVENVLEWWVIAERYHLRITLAQLERSSNDRNRLLSLRHMSANAKASLFKLDSQTVAALLVHMSQHMT
ncbi:hypothetical protein WJX72_005096 [[Myrmecia] bisecta]|uniref:BTB domain-containing protein n=1 Tax=[Myrmecia] bisecta TaxID=41462 RepID=A0AAW1NYQ2_9CHLO